MRIKLELKHNISKGVMAALAHNCTCHEKTASGFKDCIVSD